MKTAAVVMAVTIAGEMILPGVAFLRPIRDRCQTWSESRPI